MNNLTEYWLNLINSLVDSYYYSNHSDRQFLAIIDGKLFGLDPNEGTYWVSSLVDVHGSTDEFYIDNTIPWKTSADLLALYARQSS